MLAAIYAPTPAAPVRKPRDGLTAVRGKAVAAVAQGSHHLIFISVLGLNLEGGVMVARLAAPVVNFATEKPPRLIYE